MRGARKVDVECFFGIIVGVLQLFSVMQLIYEDGRLCEGYREGQRTFDVKYCQINFLPIESERFGLLLLILLYLHCMQVYTKKLKLILAQQLSSILQRRQTRDTHITNERFHLHLIIPYDAKNLRLFLTSKNFQTQQQPHARDCTRPDNRSCKVHWERSSSLSIRSAELYTYCPSFN